MSWGKEDLKRLREEYGKHKPEQLEALFNKPIKAIRAKAYVRGIKAKPGSETYDRLFRLRPGRPLKYYAELLGVSRSSVVNHLRRYRNEK